MVAFLQRARTATVIAAAGALLAAGVVAGAAGGYMILGAANDSGVSQTTLTNAGLGAAFTLRTTNVSTNATGIFGWSSQTGTNATRGVYGRADGENSYGVYAAQNGAVGGAGAAIYAVGNDNQAIIATSAEDTAITGTATGCTGLFCGSNGVSGSGAGLFAAGVFGDGTTGGLAGVWGSGAPSLYGVLGIGDATNGFGVLGTACTGVLGNGNDSATINTVCDDGGGFFSPGGAFSGTNGVIGLSGGPGYGVGVVAEQGTGAWAFYATGPSYFAGNVTIAGICTGCTAAAFGVNASGTTLAQGQAVTLAGVQTAEDGSIVVVVTAAKKGGAVFGVVDRTVALSPARISTGAGTMRVPVPDKGWIDVQTPSRTVEDQTRKWLDGATTVASGSHLRIITSGIFAYNAAAPSGTAVGDSLTVSDGGSLEQAGASVAKGATVGRYLGTLADGRVVLLISPN